jgi:hypothetical protein
MHCVFFCCQGSRQAHLTEDDVRNHIGQQRSAWEKCLGLYACANCRREYKESDIGRRASFTCSSCFQSTCVHCSNTAHPGLSCTTRASENSTVGANYVSCPYCSAPHAVYTGASMDLPKCSNCHMLFSYNYFGEIRASTCSSFASSLQELSSLRSIRIPGVCEEPDACDVAVLIAVPIQTWTLQAKAAPHWPRCSASSLLFTG